nr:MAG TPA: hypothetical protein [Caudoviricetes sp.]
MMEIEHPKLLRKIDGINEDFRKAKIGFSKYWEESTYKVEGQTREYREFLITKKGCEFLAHKTTGTKGNLFTDKYMDRFSEMEQYIKEEIQQPKKLSAMEQLKLQYQVLDEHDKEIKEVKGEVRDLKDNMPLFNVECKELQATVRKLGIKLMGGKDTNAYKDNSLRGKIYSDIQTEVKRQFQVTRYEAIKRSQLSTAYEILENYKLPMALKDEIARINNQVSFEEAM